MMKRETMRLHCEWTGEVWVRGYTIIMQANRSPVKQDPSRREQQTRKAKNLYIHSSMGIAR